MLRQAQNRLVFEFDSETVWIEPWGQNAFRVRASKQQIVHREAQALEETAPSGDKPKVTFPEDGSATITNGNISAGITKRGKITFRDARTGEIVLEEFQRSRQDLTDPKCSALSLRPREFKPIAGGDYHLTARFESRDPNEKIFGMGQYQQPYLDLKGSDVELAQRNSQASVPFMLSSLGYGFLWNNPAVGRAVFGKNLTTYEAYATCDLDYWIVVADTPAKILESYTGVTGRPPQMPEYGLGFWQCKLRYETQDELLEVAREYHHRKLPLDVLVIDFFHWPKQGEWKFDPKYWPDPGKLHLYLIRRTSLTLSSCHGQGTQVTRHRTHGLDLADCRRQIRELPRNA
jgi:alpha-D-xyloside xylohydrolase